MDMLNIIDAGIRSACRCWSAGVPACAVTLAEHGGPAAAPVATTPTS